MSAADLLEIKRFQAALNAYIAKQVNQVGDVSYGTVADPSGPTVVLDGSQTPVPTVNIQPTYMPTAGDRVALYTRNGVILTLGVVSSNPTTSLTQPTSGDVSGTLPGPLVVEQVQGVALTAAQVETLSKLANMASPSGKVVSATSTTTSTTGVMAGLAFTYTPKSTGNLVVMLAGRCGTATAEALVEITPRYGTGSPPAAGASPTGTAFPSEEENIESPDLAPQGAYAFVARLSGLTPGVAMWVDLEFATSASADEAEIASNQCVIFETL